MWIEKERERGKIKPGAGYGQRPSALSLSIFFFDIIILEKSKRNQK